ncbi:hypothetical protein GN958_ATG06031 [Phytophthora infestans]|uniref:M96 mating-specific protein family n=1 Tax=Phytophthora infestans TaxID=4787 RepID=A0A8S9UWW4_PHYIN|nr:hypothetical protein GN958_ATG06031 [Phytophthora infestans]
MQANNELLSDAAFFEEAADLLDGNCLSPTSTLFTDVDERETNVGTEMLVILESSEGASSHLSSTTPSPNNSETSTDERDLAIIVLTMHREKEKLRRRKQRQRVKDELDKLREANDELSLKLKKLKLAKEARRNPSQRCSVWKEIALKQWEERQRSETEKRRLTTTAKVQATYIKDLRRTAPMFTITDTTDHRLETPDVSMFSTLLQKICASLAGIDDILTGCGLPDMPIGVTSSIHWCDGTGELKYHQSLHKFFLPFDLDTAEKSCWGSFNLQQHQRDRKNYDGIGDSDNTVAFKYRVIRRLASGTTVSVVQRLVGRRFIEQNRATCIWKTYTEGEGIFRGMHSNLTAWSRLRPIPDGCGTSGEICIRQFPVLFNASPPSVNEFYRFLQAVLDEDKYESFTVIRKGLPERLRFKQ